ncbi:unnamed protein product [Candida verbasci]|uniref:Uncharacterized protein n=1 Tax=Candida verbasci TaxID=1227364 RepID=A0A9W4TUX7_9ASCO|nr:unnamed protein product [Candida verbasci]
MRLNRSFIRFTSSGIQGVEGRLPIIQQEHDFTALSITDPYVLYQNYTQRGILKKDDAQLRVMKEFQRLYFRVIDYKPPEELSIKLSLLLRKLEIKNNHSKFNIFKKDPRIRRTEIIKSMTDEEELIQLASPKGLLINGDVGSGKSLLTDIFASSLPHKSKMRWHYNNFILWVFNEMHNIQQEGNYRKNDFKMENEFLLYEIAQKMIEKNTILILDEFVLPDIAAANIVKILFTFYFKLGGVLIATSNKLPEELYSNQFQKMKFKNFVNILNTKCVTIDMKSEVDYRTKFAIESLMKPNLIIRKDNQSHDKKWEELIKQEVLKTDSSKSIAELGKRESITVYNRKTEIVSFGNGVCYLDFDKLCRGLTSSSDCITIASKYHTIILDNVPIMTYKMKNEARRFITLLDAIYESKCQFYMRSEVGVDHLFFPDMLNKDNDEIMDYLRSQKYEIDDNRLQVQDEETFAKTSIAMMNPYRPNTSTYDQSHTEHFEETITKSNYSNTKAFTGDDEKFAFKRAVSRIKEMVGSDIWRSENRWIPIDDTMRPWERKTHNNEMKNTKNSDFDQYRLEDQLKIINKI